MRVMISSEGDHEPKGHHYMVVDNHGLLLDLTKVVGNLVDPTIKRVTWDLQNDGQAMREGGLILRQDGGKQQFWDRSVLKPYLAAFEAKKAELAQQQKDAHGQS